MTIIEVLEEIKESVSEKIIQKEALMEKIKSYVEGLENTLNTLDDRIITETAIQENKEVDKESNPDVYHHAGGRSCVDCTTKSMCVELLPNKNYCVNWGVAS